MKRIYWILLVLATVIASSCSKEDETVDDKLNGLSFSSDVLGIRYYNEDSSGNEYLSFKNNILTYIPSSYYKKDVATSGEFPWSGNIKEAVTYSLNFGSNTCKLLANRKTTSDLVLKKGEQHLYSFNIMNQPGNNGVNVTIGSSKIKVDSGNFIDSWVLEDYKVSFVEWGSESSKLNDVSESNSEEEYRYVRTGEEIVFTNKEKELRGKIDFGKMILELEQISPTKERVGEFNLK